MKVTTHDLRAVVDMLLEKEPAGCCCHIAIEDHNLDDNSVAYCIRRAAAQKHFLCWVVARALGGLAEEEREHVVAFGGPYK